jgi:hypothetical protein
MGFNSGLKGLMSVAKLQVLTENYKPGYHSAYILYTAKANTHFMYLIVKESF